MQKGEKKEAICSSCSISDATLTLWREAVPENATAADSIRSDHDSFPAIGKTEPRFRTLEKSTDTIPDFRLGEKIGSGGMGVVYEANQTALNREVAVKMVKPGRKGSGAAADALMAEAVVTGRLEHPNVVPVYDLGVDAEGNLFYAMKEVQGFPWSKLMAERTLDENLDTLLRVADTVSFAHSRGILHRDLKPQNIMLGEFGEVMVMDWGASCMVNPEDGVCGHSAESSFCGTPAYMPPEMARGDLNRQGETCDVYLLGAMLYQIITGHPPRLERDPVLCLSQASENYIEESAEDGELLRIALKAMSTAPADRFSNVRNFQRAIREYRSHSESLLVMENAKINLLRAGQERDYDLFSRAIYGFREALQLWPENPDAEQLRIKATLEYARCAFTNKDLELAQSLLDSKDPDHAELFELVIKAIRDRDAHKRRSRRLLFLVRTLIFLLLVIFVFAFFLIRGEQRKTLDEHRQSLVNLIAAYYGEQNYEATVASFWTLHDQYGMEVLDHDSLLDVRVAAAMNPYRGDVVSGVDQPLGFARAVEEGSVWVVASNQLARIQFDDADYLPESMVSIHHFSFGKYKPAGRVVETIELPFPVAGSASVFQGADGVIWAGSGSVLYQKTSNDWNAVLDLSALDYPPLPDEYNIDREAVEKWMHEKGRKSSINGIVLNRAQTHAAVSLGSQTVCWIDLNARKCLGWLATGYGTRHRSLLRGGGNVLLALSPDEKRLVYRPSGQNRSLVFWFRLPGLLREAYAYNRDYSILATTFSENSYFDAVFSNGQLFSPSTRFMNYTRKYAFFTEKDYHDWDPVRGDMEALPFGDIHRAAFSPNGKRCCILSADGVLYVRGGLNATANEVRRQIAARDVVDIYLTDDDRVIQLGADGFLHIYDMRSYSVGPLPCDGQVVNLCRGDPPDNLLVGLKTGGKRRVIKVSSDPSNILTDEPLLTRSVLSICYDPFGRYFSTVEGRTGTVYRVDTGEQELQFVSAWMGTDGPALWMKFDETGKYFCYGGDWHSDLRIYETESWSNVYSVIYAETNLAHFTDVKIDHYDGKTNLVFTRAGQNLFESHSIDSATMEISTNWISNTGSSPLFIIPFNDPATGQRKYWCKLWFQDFQLYNAETGAASATQKHWVRKGVQVPEYIERDRRVVFPMEDGRVNIALKPDLYPVFDPRVLDFNVDEVLMSSDASLLFLLSDDKLYKMKLPAGYDSSRFNED